MDRVVDFLSWGLFWVLDVLRGWVGHAMTIFEWPAQVLGVPTEMLAAVVLCVALLAMWRAMGGYFT
jgi:hypothetical protein